MTQDIQLRLFVVNVVDWRFGGQPQTKFKFGTNSRRKKFKRNPTRRPIIIKEMNKMCNLEHINVYFFGERTLLRRRVFTVVYL
jgi:hypothetical protein